MIAVEEFNDCLKKQISMNNNHFSTLENSKISVIIQK
jgi:hypothetical protein